MSPSKHEETWRRTLDGVLASAEFRHAAKHQRLLSYLVDAVTSREAGALKEATIALDVFERDAASYDPRRDAVVRVEMQRLRKRLAAAQHEGESVHVIEIPLGAYAPVLSMRAQREPAPGVWRPVLPARSTLQRLAVLPFAEAAATGSADLLYEALLASLSSLPHLRLISTAANRHVPLEAGNVPLLAHRLGADLLLDGHLSQPDGRLVARLRLARGSDGLQLVLRELAVPWPGGEGWADDLAQRIVDALGPWFSVPLRSVAAGAREARPEVAAKLAQARLFARQATPESEARAHQLVEQAIRTQPGLARAHMQLAILDGNAANRDMRHFPQLVWQALGHAEHAVQLDPADADARSLLTWYRYVTELDLGQALASLQALSEQSPGSRLVFHAYGALCSHTGRSDDAVRYFRISGEFEPMEVNPLFAAALALVNGYRFAEALVMLDEVLELEARHVYAQRWRADCLSALGRDAEARAALARLEAEQGIPGDEAACMRAAFAARRGDAAGCAACYAEPAAQTLVDALPTLQAVRAIHLGQHDLAADVVAQLIARRDPRLVYQFGGANGLALRREPRIDAQAQSIGWLPLPAA